MRIYREEAIELQIILREFGLLDQHSSICPFDVIDFSVDGGRAGEPNVSPNEYESEPGSTGTDAILETETVDDHDHVNGYRYNFDSDKIADISETDDSDTGGLVVDDDDTDDEVDDSSLNETV